MSLLAFAAKLFGILGLLLITYGVFAKDERRQDWIFVSGGAGLLIYSMHLRDPIFIVLQIVFIAAGLYELSTLNKKTKKK